MTRSPFIADQLKAAWDDNQLDRCRRRRSLGSQRAIHTSCNSGATIGLQDVQDATTLAIKKLNERLFRVRFDRLASREKDYLRTMAELGSGHQRSGENRRKRRTYGAKVAPVRNSLIKKGMIYSPSHGDTAFTVPRSKPARKLNLLPA